MSLDGRKSDSPVSSIMRCVVLEGNEMRPFVLDTGVNKLYLCIRAAVMMTGFSTMPLSKHRAAVLSKSRLRWAYAVAAAVPEPDAVV